MNENINLCKLLKGHEGETFYSLIFGDVVLKHSNRKGDYPIGVNTAYCNHFENFTQDGRYFNRYNAECMLFPSKDQRDWNKWAEEQKPKVPKTWKELRAQDKHNSYVLGHGWGIMSFTDIGKTPIEKSALAFIKIRQLIEVGYGGNITDDEWKDSSIEKFIIVPINDGFKIDHRFKLRAFRHIAFHTRKQAEEFLSYPENVQLLKDFYMV